MRRVALVMTNYGDVRCGVGRSLAALVDDSSTRGDVDVEVLNPHLGSVLGWWRCCRGAAEQFEGVIIVYPTREALEKPWFFARALIARVLFRRGSVRVYLHEYRRFGRRHRPFAAALAGLGRDGILVSTRAEAEALRGRWPSTVTRGKPFEIVPPANGTAPTGQPVRRSIDRVRRQRTVGIFGMLRPDKGERWAYDVLVRLQDVDRLELAGSGWESAQVPETVRRRYEVVLLGHVADAEVAGVLAGWRAALAPFADGPHDGRLSLRTPLAHGVPTLTSPPQAGELTLAASHLQIIQPGTAPVPLLDLTDADRASAAAAVADWETIVRRRLSRAMFHGARR